jgi:hypothetical protein
VEPRLRQCLGNRKLSEVTVSWETEEIFHLRLQAKCNGKILERRFLHFYPHSLWFQYLSVVVGQIVALGIGDVKRPEHPLTLVPGFTKRQ